MFKFETCFSVKPCICSTSNIMVTGVYVICLKSGVKIVYHLTVKGLHYEKNIKYNLSPVWLKNVTVKTEIDSFEIKLVLEVDIVSLQVIL